MKRLAWTLLTTLLMIGNQATGQSSVTLDFRASNPRIRYDFNTTCNGYCDNLLFDLEIKASAPTYYYSLEVHTTMDSNTVADLDWINGPLVSTAYLVTFNTINQNINLAINANKTIDQTSTSGFSLITTEWQSLGTVALRITDNTVECNFEWLTSWMEGCQLEKTFNPADIAEYQGFTVENTPFAGLYTGRLWSGSEWSQTGGTEAGVTFLDWSVPVNTSVWQGTPTLTTGPCHAAALRIHAPAMLTLAPGAQLTCTGPTEIQGPEALIIGSEESGSGSFIDNGTITYPSSGSAGVRQYLSPDGWHYVSTPTENATAGVYLHDYLVPWNAASDDWGAYITDPSAPLTPGKGYAVWVPSTTSSPVKIFTGSLNTATVAFPCSEAGSGFNLTGNPYPSALDLTRVTWPSAEQTAWFWDQQINNYVVYNNAPSTHTQYVPSMQGFFIKTDAAGNFTVDNTSRTHQSEAFLKSGNAFSNALYLKASGSLNGYRDEAVIWFDSRMTNGYDPGYDAEKKTGGEAAPQLYTTAANGERRTIQALPFTERQTIVPVAFSCGLSGNYTLAAFNLESFDKGITLELEDLRDHTTIDLALQPEYQFSYTAGDSPDRFLLHCYRPAAGNGQPTEAVSWIIYTRGRHLFIQNDRPEEGQGEVAVCNVLGQLLRRFPLTEALSGGVLLDLPPGAYLVRILTGGSATGTKILLTEQ